MTTLGRFTGNVRDELAAVADMSRQFLAGLPTVSDGGAPVRTNVPRLAVTADVGALTTQVMTSVALYLRKGDVVTNLSFRSGATAAATPTNYWFALYSTASPAALLGQTADQLTAAWPASTTKTLALAAPVTIPSDGIYWAAIMVKATTVPSLAGPPSPLLAAPVFTGEKALAQTSGSALTTTAPATIASPTAVATLPWCAAS